MRIHTSLALLWILTFTTNLVAHGGGPYRGPGDVLPPRYSEWLTWWGSVGPEFSTVYAVPSVPLARLGVLAMSLRFEANENFEHSAAILEGMARLARELESEPVHAALLRGLRCGDEAVQAKALECFGIAGHFQALEVLVEVAGDTLVGQEFVDPSRRKTVTTKLRSAACRGLGFLARTRFMREDFGCRLRIHAALDGVLQGSNSQSPDLSSAAVAALANLEVDAAATDKHERGLARGVFRTLTRFHDAVLPAAFAESQGKVPLAWARLLRRGDSPRHRHIKARLLHSLRGDGGPRAKRQQVQVVEALGRLVLPSKEDRDYSVMLRSLAEKGGFQACLALARIGGRENVEALLALLDGEHPYTAAAAAMSLGVACHEAGERAPAISPARRKEIERRLRARGESVRAMSLHTASILGLQLCGRSSRGEVERRRESERRIAMLAKTVMDPWAQAEARVQAVEKLARLLPVR